MKRIAGTPTVEQLRSIRLFRGVERSVLAALAEKLETCEVDAEELLLSPHTLNRHLYMLVRGQLSVQLASRDNPPVRYVEVNDCVGEVSFCDHRPPSAYVIASEPSRVVRLHSRELPLLTQSPELMQNLIELLCDRVRLTDQLIINSEHNANIDMLTGVFNRRWLEHIFERESARCAFSGQPLCMLMIDAMSSSHTTTGMGISQAIMRSARSRGCWGRNCDRRTAWCVSVAKNSSPCFPSWTCPRHALLPSACVSVSHRTTPSPRRSDLCRALRSR
jgi:CRP-like cAMP-binding protein